jgi:hypothetical protein
MAIAKQNMLTNSYKNVELANNKQDMIELNKTISQFTSDLTQISEFNTKLTKIQ